MIISGDPKTVAGAYISARSEIETLLVKDGKANRSTYPTLAGILATITPTLIKHGLVILQETTSNEFGVGVSTTLLHTSGSSIDFAPLTMMPADLKPQTVGSTISYARRYALVSALGLVGGKEDDDGAAGSQGEPKTKPAANGGSPLGADDALWEPTEKPKSKEPASQAQIKRANVLGVKYYGSLGWAQKAAEVARGASKGAVDTIEALKIVEIEVVITGLETRIAERAAKLGSPLGAAA